MAAGVSRLYASSTQEYLGSEDAALGLYLGIRFSTPSKLTKFAGLFGKNESVMARPLSLSSIT